MSKAFTRQQGSIVAFLVLGIAAAAILASVAFTGYFQITRGASVAGLVAQSNALLAQAAHTLTTESSDSDGDGYLEAPAMNPVSPAPSGGGQIPVTSGAPKSDAWGTALGYCSWDNGSIASSTNRISGDNPGTQGSVVLAIISAGANKTFETTCAQARAGTPQGDDRVVTYSQSQMVQGVGGTVYFGDPVANATALGALNTSTLKDGQVRLEKDTNSLERWDSTSSSWKPIQAATGSTAVGGFRNVLINGNFDLWQRGVYTLTSVTGVNFLADRWIINGGVTPYGTAPLVGLGTYSAARISTQAAPAANIANAVYGIKVSGATKSSGFGGDLEVVSQRIEDVRTLAGSTATATFWILTGAGKTLCADFAQFLGPGLPLTTGIGRTCYVGTGSWQKISFTATIPNVGTGPFPAGNSLWFRPILEPFTSRSDGWSASLAQAQVEAGSSATSFDLRPLSLELAMAQRYYETGAGVSDSQSYGVNAWAHVSFQVAKRIVPPVAPTLVPAGTGGSLACSALPTLGHFNEYGLTISRPSTSTSSLQCWFTQGWSADAELVD